MYDALKYCTKCLCVIGEVYQSKGKWKCVNGGCKHFSMYKPGNWYRIENNSEVQLKIEWK